jgi:hypothetical protein
MLYIWEDIMAKSKQTWVSKTWAVSGDFTVSTISSATKVVKESLGAAEDTAAIIHAGSTVGRLAMDSLCGEYFTDERVENARKGHSLIVEARKGY